MADTSAAKAIESIPWLEAVPDPRFRHNIARSAILALKLLAQMPHENPEVLRLLHAILSPDSRKQCSMGDHLIGIPREIHKQIELFRSEMNVTVAYANRACLHIDVKIADFNQVGFRLFPCGRPSQSGSHPCQQFIHIEWLGHIVIRTRIERLNLGTLISFHRKHDDWHL